MNKISKFFVAAVAVVAIFASTASAAYMHNGTLKMGARGAQVTSLQQALNATAWPVDGGLATGYFGSMTKAAVVAFQNAHPETGAADGIVGAKTGAAIAALGGSVSGNFPAGCTSASGFSSVTGQPCVSINANVFPTGCTSASGFSPVTGASCSGSTTSTGVLTGGAGDAAITETSTDVESTVNEGASNTKIHGFKVEADGSDIAVTSVKVNFVADGAGSPASSYRLNHYTDTVSVWMGSTKVGSANVEDFSKDGNNYSKSIALSGAVVRDGSSNKQTFYVTVDALDNIDSNDFAANWTITASNIRFQDATGAVLTDGYSETSVFDFSSLASSGDVKLVVSKGSANPVAGNVEVSDSASTSNVLMLEFKLKDTGSKMTFDTLTVDLTGVVSGANDLADMVSELTLKHGSDVLATDSSYTGDTDTVVFNLDNTYTIDADSTDTFRIYAKIADVDNFSSGDSLKVDFNDIAAEDSNGDVVTETGSADGEVQTFVNDGAAIAYVSDTYTADDATNDVDGTISMKFTVTAIGDNDIVLSEDQFGTAKTTGVDSQSAGANVVVFNVTGATTSDAILTSTTVTKDGSNNFTISAGSTETFTLVVKTLHDTTSGFVRLAITNVASTAIANTVQTAAH